MATVRIRKCGPRVSNFSLSGVYRGCCKGGGDEGYGYREGGGGYGGGGGGYGGGLTSTRVEATMVAMAVVLAGQLVDVVKLSTIFANLYLSFSQFTMDALIPYYCSLFKNLEIKKKALKVDLQIQRKCSQESHAQMGEARKFGLDALSLSLLKWEMPENLV
ncbi:hypothetical protein LguiA_017806 [Lonicera macranthoides]